jgi:helicase
VPTNAGRVLAAKGVRHRRAAVELGKVLTIQGSPTDDEAALFSSAEQLLNADPDHWRTRLGPVVFDNTLQDTIR